MEVIIVSFLSIILIVCLWIALMVWDDLKYKTKQIEYLQFSLDKVRVELNELRNQVYRRE